MKRSFILPVLILMFSILNGQSLYHKYALPAFKKSNDTTTSSSPKKTSSTSALIIPKIAAGQSFGGQDIQVFPSDVEQSEVHISLNVNNPTQLLISANTFLGPKEF